MTTSNGVAIKVEQGRIQEALQEAVTRLDDSNTELALDFSSVHRIDSAALREMEKLASTAGEKSVRVVLQGTDVDVYKVLKLTKLSSRFSFVA